MLGCWRWVSTRPQESENKTLLASSAKLLTIHLAATCLSTLFVTSGQNCAKCKCLLLLKSFLSNNYNLPSFDRFPSTFSSMSGIIKAVATSFNTELELKEVNQVAKNNYSVINVKNHFLFDVRNSWFSSGRKRVKGLAVRNELLSSRSTGPRTISTGWDKITRRWWTGFNASTRVGNSTQILIFICSRNLLTLCFSSFGSPLHFTPQLMMTNHITGWFSEMIPFGNS